MISGIYCDSVPLPINLDVDRQPINRVEFYNYLEVYFDYKWDTNIKYLIKKNKYLLFIFSKLVKCMQKFL